MKNHNNYTSHPPIDLEHVRQFAAAAHASVVNPDGSLGQRRKYTNEPYILHPLAVAGIVATMPGATQEMIAAALLHDVVEDTPITQALIDDQFGPLVGSYVEWLTDITTLEDGNRQVRAQINRERLARAPAEVQSIKTADILHNCSSIAALNPKYALKYLPEKIQTLDMLTLADKGLLGWTKQICISSLRRIGEELGQDGVRPESGRQRPR